VDGTRIGRVVTAGVVRMRAFQSSSSPFSFVDTFASLLDCYSHVESSHDTTEAETSVTPKFDPLENVLNVKSWKRLLPPSN
jgi:hypothetical protein